jgi:hypothetical protein
MIQYTNIKPLGSGVRWSRSQELPFILVKRCCRIDSRSIKKTKSIGSYQLNTMVHELRSFPNCTRTLIPYGMGLSKTAQDIMTKEVDMSLYTTMNKEIDKFFLREFIYNN